MALHVQRGFKRLLIALTIGWAIFCTVLYPLKCQFDGQDKAEVQHYKDIMECGQHLGAFLCFDRVDQDYRAMMDRHALNKFWMWDIALWMLVVPAVVIPPLALYGLSALSKWIWRGFHSAVDREALT
jgi:hypothetical protein